VEKREGITAGKFHLNDIGSELEFGDCVKAFSKVWLNGERISRLSQNLQKFVVRQEIEPANSLVNKDVISVRIEI